MTELTFHQQAVLWGQAYEVLVKRGVLACLIEQGLIERNRPGLERWRELKLLDVSRSLTKELNILDEAARDVIKAGVRQLALTAYGVGYTATREYLKAVRKNFAKNPDVLKVKALWCPLMLPGESTLEQSARAENREAFYKELGLTGIVDPDWSRKGQPANADFLLWLSAGAPKDDYLLVQEYSYDMPGSLGDFREQGAHLDELTRHRRTVDSRSVFARVAAEVSGEAFELSEDIQNYLGALTGDNKPVVPNARPRLIRADEDGADVKLADKVMELEDAHEDLSRTIAQRKFLKEKNVSLKKPLEWEMYGDPFRIDK